MKKIPAIMAGGLALVLFLLCAGTTRSVAQTNVPRVISYQGILSRTNGGVVADGQYTLTFRLYTDSLGLQPLWLGIYNTTLRGGVFSVLLGYGDDPLPSNAEMDRPLWLGVRVDNEAELRPLTPFTAAPYALNVPNGSITAPKLADGSVTADKLSVNYISAITVQGRSLTGNASSVNIKGAGGIDVNYDPISKSVVIGTQTGNLVSTPDPLDGNTDNYQIDAYATYIRISNVGDQPIMLTGIDHTGVAYGRVVTLANIGSYPIVLKHRNGSSALPNQFDLPAASDVILASHGAATLIYDQLLRCWALVGTN